MRCSEVPAAIADVLGGEAPAGLRQALDLHVARCPACARHHQGLGELMARARSVDVPEPGPEYWRGFRLELERRIAREAAATGTTAWHLPLASALAWLRPLAATAAMVALTFVALPRPSTRPAIAAPVASIDPARAEALAAALDPFAAEGALTRPLAELDRASALASEADASGAPSANPFAFFDATERLSDAQTSEVLAALAADYAG